MFCTNCGKQNSDEATFCEQCGTSLKQAKQAQATPQQQPIHVHVQQRPAPSRGPLFYIVIITVSFCCVIPGLFVLLSLIFTGGIGLLGAAAIPKYAESAVTLEVNSSVTQAKKSVTKFVSIKGRLPKDLKEAGVAITSSKFKTSLDSSSGAILFSITSPPFNGKTLKLTPDINGKTVDSWKCESENIPANQLNRFCN